MDFFPHELSRTSDERRAVAIKADLIIGFICDLILGKTRNSEFEKIVRVSIGLHCSRKRRDVKKFPFDPNPYKYLLPRPGVHGNAFYLFIVYSRHA
jgi:hypothetical protein